MISVSYTHLDVYKRQTTPSVDASLISMLEAILNPIWVALVIGEIPSFISLIGSGLVLISVVFNIISSKNEKRCV